ALRREEGRRGRSRRRRDGPGAALAAGCLHRAGWRSAHDVLVSEPLQGPGGSHRGARKGRGADWKRGSRIDLAQDRQSQWLAADGGLREYGPPIVGQLFEIPGGWIAAASLAGRISPYSVRRLPAVDRRKLGPSARNPRR